MQTTVSSGSRIGWVDALKAIAMFCVFLGHFGENAGGFYVFVFMFHIQTFFFASGLFASKLTQLPLVDFLKNLLRRLVIPYLFLCALNIIAKLLFYPEGASASELIVQCLLGKRNEMFVASL